LSVFGEVFGALPRQGPGCDADTLQALDLVQRDWGPIERILDVGCGCGFQTLTLLKNTQARVTALDLSKGLLSRLVESVAADGLADRVETVACSMMEMPFEAQSFDLIWSEGAVFIMGFEAAATAFRKLLRPGGRVVISDAVWLVEDPPEEAIAWWRSEGETLVHFAERWKQLAEQGYRRVAGFTGSEAGWWEPYLTPMAERVAALRGVRTASEDVAVLDALDREIATHRAYLGTYGYRFYIAERVEADGTLTVNDSDFGEGADENTPFDVKVSAEWPNPSPTYMYGEDVSFSCSTASESCQ
jgi:SAM-dependent methyltransferase